MYKIRKVSFFDHPILKNLKLDFCDNDGKAVDTVIFAGENGTGKSTILDSIYQIITQSGKFDVDIDLEIDNTIRKLTYRKIIHSNGTSLIQVKDNNGFKTFVNNLRDVYQFSGIYSDVDINFHAQPVSSVTSLTLDSVTTSRRSATDLPKQINQLLIDIQALDDADLAYAYRSAKSAGCPVSEITYPERMKRFTTAFNSLFDNLKYSRITNKDGRKVIVFKKDGVDVPIDNLSSGEKQIVYRGCFLLKDANAMNGAFVFIDEPEISLHPNWQMKIMDYYKGIFTDENGKQTSQIFAVTHSPFIIHNENRRNDKVIIITRDKNGDVVVKDKPEYFKCDSVEAVQDAFSIQSFSVEQPTVYLEGRTDEKYFKRAVEVFGFDVPFQFKWIGYIDDRGQEANTGDKSLDNAFQFLASRNLSVRNICLKDCDTNRPLTKKNNAIILAMPTYQNSMKMQKGIENALVLDDIDLTPFYIKKESVGEYGEKKIIETFDKMACCDAICAMDDDALKGIFVNLGAMIVKLMDLCNEE
ncbi:MAG: AAA family ATPase [Acetatifactor sp.]